jgi:hypothetical protein
VAVPVVAIDDLGLPGCDFMKIDVGLNDELGVVEGATDTIVKCGPDGGHCGTSVIPCMVAQRSLTCEVAIE